MKILDRYLVRETLPPFFLALAVFTFLFGVKPMLEQAQIFLSKGVDLPTVGFLLLTLLPQALGITIPMAFLTGLLMALGRFSGDRESVALQACGVSPVRLLRPVLMAAAVAAALDLYMLTTLVPDANQRFREETYQVLVRQSEGDIKPGRFYEGFPGKVLFVREMRPGGGWSGVMLADVTKAGRPIVTVAEQGYLELNAAERSVSIVLPGRSERHVPGDEPGVYDRSEQQDVRFAVPADSVFGDGTLGPSRGPAEMTYADLGAEGARRVAAGLSPHNEIMKQQQMFSFPVACFVFAIIGLALGLHTRKDGRFGGFTLGIIVILMYYALMSVFEGRTQGGAFPALWARWVPNIALGVVGIAAVWWRTHASGRELAIPVPAWFKLRRKASATDPGAAQKSAVTETRRSGVVLVLRLPNFALPKPRILDVYVGSRYARVALIAFVGLLCLYYVGTLIDKSSKLFKGQADMAMMFEFFYYSTPQYIVHLVPMAVLVAVLATIGGLTRSGELIVMRACGVSIYRVALPLFLLALVWSGGLFLIDDRVLAKANRRAEVLDDVIRGNTPHTVNQVANSNWSADPERSAIYYYNAFDIPRRTLYGLSAFELGPKSDRLMSQTTASVAKFENGAWVAQRGWVQKFAAGDQSTRESFDRRPVVLAPPENFSGMHNSEAALMTYGELRAHIGRLAASGMNLAESRVSMEARIAFPMVTIVMTLLGVPFGVTTGRRGALYGIGLAISLAAAYWLVNTFFIAVGHADLLPPMLAAWAANILFLAMAAYMTLTVRT